MDIHTWVATDADNPAPAIAMIRMPMEGAAGKGRVVGLGWLPVWFSAATPEEARARAQAHWDAEMERERSKKPRGRPKKMEAAPGTDAVDIEETV